MAAPQNTRVGFVIGQLSVGGAEGQLCELLRHLAPRFVPSVFCLADQPGQVADDLRRLNVEVCTVGSHGLQRAVRLGRMLRERHVDLVHSWLFIANGYAAAATALGCMRPLITSARNCKVQGRASQLVNGVAFRCSRAIVVNSRDVEEYIVDRYAAPRARVRVIANGIDTQRFHPPASPASNGNGKLIVGIGRLVQQKNHALFLRAAAAVVGAQPDAHFMIVGDGPLRPELEKQAAALGLGNRLTFAGERRDTDEILRQAALFWLTSRWEGMPNTVLEALASGVPAIATDVGGVREVIRDGIDGFIVASDDQAAFVSRTLALLGDPAARQQVAVNARARAEDFSPKRMAESFERLYDQILV